MENEKDYGPSDFFNQENRTDVIKRKMEIFAA